MERLRVVLLGPPRVETDSNHGLLPAKSLALIALTARHPRRRRRRDEAATLLWPEDDRVRSRHNLRQTLWLVRQSFGSRLLSSSRDEIWLADESVDVDVDHFLAGPERVEDESSALMSDRALNFYQGEFLEGINLSAGTEFDDWLLFEREELRAIWRKRVIEFGEWQAASTGVSVDSLPHLEALARSDPLDEDTVRLLMLLYTAAGDANRALRSYEHLTRMLERELGVDPGPETTAVASDIRTRRASRPTSSTSSVARSTPKPVSAASRSRPASNPPRYVAVIAVLAQPLLAVHPSDSQWRTIISEYRYAANALASQFGCIHREQWGDGQLFVFRDVNTAAQFGTTLLRGSAAPGQDEGRSQHALSVRMGCHFGEGAPLGQRDTWVGRGIEVAKRVARVTPPTVLTVTESAADLLDLSLHELRRCETPPLRGDHLPDRRVFTVAPPQDKGLIRSAVTADEWFIRATTLIGGPGENSAEESECYRRALELNPRHAEAHNNLAVLLRSSGNDDAAAEHYREALRARPEYPEAHYNYAVLLQSRGSFAGAAYHYREALRTRPDYVDAHLALSSLLAAQGDFTGAARRCRRVLSLRPGWAEAHNNYAIILEDLGDVEGAFRHYVEALELRPDYVAAHYNYAILLENEGKSGEAETHYRIAVELFPGYAEAYNNLGILLQRKGQLTEAETYYRHALELRPNDPEIHYNFAALMDVTGSVDRATEHRRIASDLITSESTFHTLID